MKFKEFLAEGGAPPPDRVDLRSKERSCRADDRAPTDPQRPEERALFAMQAGCPAPDDISSASAADVGAIARQIVVGASIASSRGAVSVCLELATPRLFGVRVELRMEQGALSARFDATDRSVANLLATLVPALETALRQRGLRLRSMDVGCSTARRQAPDRGAKDGRRR